MSAVEFSPQSAGVINVEQSEAARAKDTDIGATAISAKAATRHNRMVDFLVFITAIILRFSHDTSAHHVRLDLSETECEQPVAAFNKGAETWPGSLTAAAVRCYRS
jgi:hypothetical protein